MSFQAKYFHLLGGAFEAVPEERRRLGLWICVALVGHIVGFACIRVATPPAVPTVASQLRVTFYREASPDQEESARGGDLAFWSRINDPSLLIFPPGFLASGGGKEPLAPQPLWPGGDLGSSPLLALPPDLNPLPDALPPLPRRAAEALSVAVASPQIPNLRAALLRPAQAQTTVLWDGSAAFLARRPGEWKLSEVPGSVLLEAHPTVLRLAVDAEGRVIHAVVDQSSGRSEVDLVAIDGARRLRFKAAPDASILWGRATVYWQYAAPAGPGGGATATPEATP
jgi:TonB family protein